MEKSVFVKKPPCIIRHPQHYTENEGESAMTIAILAHDSRKELALQFCTAYSGILSRNTVIATGTTGRMLAQATGLPREKLVNMGANSEVAPDSGTTSGSRQTLITGEAVRMAAAELKADLDGAGGDLSALEGLEYSAEFFDPTDKLGADKPNPKSHVAYGFATHVVILDDDGRVKEVWAAHDSGKVVNPTSIQGQIEGGVLMGLGYALTEDFPLKDCVPQARFGTLGLMRADQIPHIHAIYVEKEELLPFAYGAKGIGEIATIPTAPAAQGAYYARDHVLRTSLPMEHTFYKK